MGDFAVFNTTPQSRKAEREQLARKIDLFLATGGTIQEIPFGIGKETPSSQAFRIKPMTVKEMKAREKKETARAATLTEIPTLITHKRK